MWIIVWVLINVIWNTVDTRHIKKLSKEDQEFENLEKRQQITGELEIGGQRFESLGCWRDAWSRSLPTLEGEHYLLMDPNYKGRRHALFKCARAALDKGYNLFGIENGGQCFASADEDKGYHKYGASKECKGDGKGGPWSLQVYRFLKKRDAVNGAYGQWSSWGTCSRTCTGGVRRRMRKCSNPPPSNGGLDCRSLGPSVESQDCNVQSCKITFGVGKPESRDLPLESTKRDEKQSQPLVAATPSFPLPTNSQHLDLPVNIKATSVESNNNIQPNNDKGEYVSMPNKNNQDMNQETNGNQQSSSNQDGDQAKMQQGKYIPMSREDIDAFKQVATFQNSKSGSNVEQAKHLQESQKPFMEGRDQENSTQVPTHQMANKKPPLPNGMHSSSTAYPKPDAVHGNDDVEAGVSSSQMSSSGEGITSENSPNEGNRIRNSSNYKESNEEDDKQSENRIDEESMTSNASGKFHDEKSRKITNEGQNQTQKGFSKVGESLRVSGPEFQGKISTDNEPDGSQHSSKFESGLDDARNVEIQMTNKGTNIEKQLNKTRQDFSNQPQVVEDQEQQPKGTAKENFKTAVQGSDHAPVNVEQKAADIQGQEGSKTANKVQETSLGKQSLNLKGDQPSDKHYNKDTSDGNEESQPKASEEERHDEGREKERASSTKIQFQGPVSQQGNKVDDSRHSPNKADALSTDGGKPVDNHSPQPAQTSPNQKQDRESMSQQESPQNVHDSDKMSSSNEKTSSQNSPEGVKNDKHESYEGQPSREEGEPVPIVDLNKSGAMNGEDYGPAPNGEFSGPDESNSMQSQPQTPGPVYDNEAIQGISEMSQRADQSVFQQQNPGNQAGPDESSEIGYDDMGSPQAYTGENVRDTPRQQKQKEAAIQERFPDQEEGQGQVGLTSDYYNTEPAEDCLCPKKECSAKADIAFLVDGSANIPQPYYARVLEFIKIFSRGFDKSNIHVGMMAYGDDVKTAFDLKALSDFKQFDDSVSIAPYVGGRAHTGKALSKLKTGLFAMSGRQDAPRALILLSSGGSADDVVAPGAELRDSGVKVTTIGLGKQANVRELITVASEPKSEHVFTAFLDTLPNAMDEIIQGVCRDVMGIVRDRQEPCTCETFSAQGAQSNDYTKVPVDKDTNDERQSTQQIQGSSYPQDQRVLETMRVPLYQNKLSQGFQLPNSSNKDFKIVEVGLSAATPGSDNRPFDKNFGQQGNNNNLKPAIGHGFRLTGVGYSKDVQGENQDHALETSQDPGVQMARPFGNRLRQSPVTNEHSIGADDNFILPDLNNSKNEHLKTDFSNHEQNQMDGPQMHRFAAGLPEHYKPHGNDGAHKLPNQGAYGEQSVESLFLYQKPGAKQDNTFSQSSAVNQARGPGLLVNSTASIYPADNVYGRPLQQQRNPTAKQGDLTSDNRRPTKVIAVGKPAEYVNSYPQEQNRQECSGVNLGVVLDSTATVNGQDLNQATMMMNLAKKVSHLFASSPAGNSVGMVVYGGSPQPSVVHFDKFLDQKTMDEAIENASKPSVEMKIGKALSMAQQELFSQLSMFNRNILLLVTDGASFDDVSRPALELKRRGIEVFCLGVGKDVNEAQLDLIASDPKENHVFLAPLNDADALMGRIQREICLAANRETRFSTQRKCPSDLGFVIDGSRSVEVLGKGNFKKMLHFVKNVSVGFSPEDTRVGVITYGTEPQLVIPFNKYTTPTSLAFAIENIPYPGTFTMTGKALTLANQKLFDSGSRINVPRVLVVLSKGASKDNVQKSAEALHKSGVAVISVGLGPSYDITELNNIASKPVAYNVLKTEFNNLPYKVKELQDKICLANDNKKLLI